jgi:hypothetical protein
MDQIDNKTCPCGKPAAILDNNNRPACGTHGLAAMIAANPSLQVYLDQKKLVSA